MSDLDKPMTVNVIVPMGYKSVQAFLDDCQLEAVSPARHDPEHISPWVPMSDPVDIAVTGKFIEEVCEAGARAARCLIQGMDELDPDKQVSNRLLMRDEVADIFASSNNLINHFKLDVGEIAKRSARKQKQKVKWFKFLKDKFWSNNNADGTARPDAPGSQG